MNLPLFPQDKATHFICGFIIFLIANIMFSNLLSLIIVLIFALAKETFDYYTKKYIDVYDIVYTIVPAILMILFNFIK